MLFDLDGTLADTVFDIAAALNEAFAHSGLPTLSVDEVRPLVGRGAPSLIQLALNHHKITFSDSQSAHLMQAFLDHYQARADAGRSLAVLFPGVSQALTQLKQARIKLAVVTNKIHRLAVSTLQHTHIFDHFEAVVGGDSVARRKPHPDVVLQALEQLGVPPASALMVGDSQYDVDAARAAGVTIWCVPYGYNEGRDPRQLACDQFLESFVELPERLAVGAPSQASGQVT